VFGEPVKTRPAENVAEDGLACADRIRQPGKGEIGFLVQHADQVGWAAGLNRTQGGANIGKNEALWQRFVKHTLRGEQTHDPI
jgi:hypothetical protein